MSKEPLLEEKEKFQEALGKTANALFCLAGEVEKTKKYDSEVIAFLKKAAHGLRFVERFLDNNRMNSINDVSAPRSSLKEAIPYADAASLNGTDRLYLDIIRDTLVTHNILLKRTDRGDKTQIEINAEKISEEVKKFRAKTICSRNF